MRLLFMIPALLLFLSNVPVTMEVKMMDPVVMAAMEEGCCASQDSKTGACSKKEEPKQETKDCGDQDQQSCSQPTTTCICTCCFQYTAPAQVITQFQTTSPANSGIHTGFLQQQYKDPQLAVPWQPPDFI